MSIRFTRPSLRRAIGSTIIVFVVSSIVVGIAVALGFIAGKDSAAPVAVGDYVRLVVASLTIWGPMYLLIAWQVSIPTVIGIGLILSSIHRGNASSGAANGTPPKDKGALETE
jgi:hypothetical protein